MSLVKLAQIKKLFGGSSLTRPEQKQLAKEVMLMTLARATSADSNIKAVEVDKVRAVLKERTGEKFTAANVRVAANSRLYEKAPFERYLHKCSRKLTAADRKATLDALLEVIRADDRVSDYEVTFFNHVAGALELTPAQIAGLSAD
jgi:uncharacterized tellurite resistance protein B-like protein